MNCETYFCSNTTIFHFPVISQIHMHHNSQIVLFTVYTRIEAPSILFFEAALMGASIQVLKMYFY